MTKKSRPKKGSHAYSPRKRVRSIVPHISAWSTSGDRVKIQGFAGYKVGMSHAFMTDYRPASTTAGQEVRVPISIIETPPINVVGIRGYKLTPYGYKTLTEAWATNLSKELAKRIPLPKKPSQKWGPIDSADEIFALVQTFPDKVHSIPNKVPELMEIRIGGGTVADRIEYAKSILGKEIDASEVIKEGDMLDIVGITKGKGFQSRTKRFGTKLLSHKNSKHRRMIGTQGPWHPSWIRSSVPSDGQMGYHQRTECNKRVLKVGTNTEEINPNGGFPHYGVVKNKYLVIHGSIPGPTKRLVRMRDAVRYQKGVKPDRVMLSYVSQTSKQG
jgi:large subunit ribosomal protein L3